MRFILAMVVGLFTSTSFADVELSSTTSQGVSANYWVITGVEVKQGVWTFETGTSDNFALRVQVNLCLFKSKADYDASKAHLEATQLVWTSGFTDFDSVDLTVTDELFAASYDKLKSLSSVSVPWEGSALDFTTATEP